MFAKLNLIICVLSSILSHTEAQQQNEYDVIIMGAGSSGIAAAKTLYEANLTNILIIEAQDYIGGRAKVVNFSNYMLNVGASWISATCNPFNLSSLIANCSTYNETNPMLAAAWKYNFSFVDPNWYSGIFLDFGGNEHNVTNSDNIQDIYFEVEDCANGILQNMTSLHPEDMSVQAALYLCGWKKPLSDMEKTIQWDNYEFDATEHAKWGGVRYDTDAGYDRYGPNDVFITDPRGYQGIIEALANEFLDIDNINNESSIILNSSITTIHYDDNRVTVTLENTTEYYAKYGIVTFSLGVLQSDIVEFIPQLPSWKIDTLLSVDFGNIIPILVKWPYNFWSQTIGDYSWNISEYILLNDERFGFFPWIYNLDHPKLFSGSLIWRFDVSLDLAEMVQYQHVNDTIKLIIDLKLSHYFVNVTIPWPDDIFVPSWKSNRYVQGSYTFLPVGYDSNANDAMQWRVERLFFAGESRHEFGGPFVHIAWLSGNRTANQILSCIGYDDMIYDCPSEYIPPSDDDDCPIMKKSVLKELIWLWIVFGVIFGTVMGYVFTKCSTKINNVAVQNKGDNYGAVDDVPMDSRT